MKVDSNSLDRRQSPDTFVLTIRSASWRSKFESFLNACHHDSYKIHFAIDFEAALRFACTCKNAIVIAELPDRFSDDPTTTLRLLCRFSNNPQQFPIFVLADFSLEPWRSVLRTSGATDTCFSMLDLASFWDRVRKYRAWIPSPRLSVECAVRARLPW